MRPSAWRRIAFAGLLLLFPLAQGSPAAGPLPVDDFAHGLRHGWKEKSFQGHTVYAPVVENGRGALRAVSRDAASALYFPVKVDLSRYPRISWSWKILRTIASGDARTKAGDDYAARLYVIFPSAFFWRTRTVNYIWANRLPRGTFLPNAYTANAVMVAVESGDAEEGRWVDEVRDVAADYRRAFGEAPPRAGAIALMTDTDNTHAEATAWYGAIRFLP